MQIAKFYVGYIVSDSLRFAWNVLGIMTVLWNVVVILQMFGN